MAISKTTEAFYRSMNDANLIQFRDVFVFELELCKTCNYPKEEAEFCELRIFLIDLIIAQRTCEHDWQEQPGEPPIDVCPSCGAIRE